MELKEISLLDCEMHRTGLELCSMACFKIIDTESLSAASRILLGVISQSRMDNPLRIDKDNACDGEKTSSLFNSFALEIGLSELKSHYRMPDCKIVELVVKFNLLHRFVTGWNTAFVVRSVAE
jgi:hypothetical protein